jgi:hypothetical protein
MIAGGAFFCFFSYRYLKTTRILTGMAFVIFVTIYVLMYHISFQITSLYFWLIIMGCIFVGIGLGCIITGYPTIASTILGGIFGYIMSQLIYQGVVIAINANPEVLFMITLIGFSLVGIYFGVKYPKYVFIISSAFLGSYSIIRVY